MYLNNYYLLIKLIKSKKKRFTFFLTSNLPNSIVKEGVANFIPFLKQFNFQAPVFT